MEKIHLILDHKDTRLSMGIATTTQKKKETTSKPPVLFDRRLVWETYDERVTAYADAFQGHRVNRLMVYDHPERRKEIKATGGAKHTDRHVHLFSRLLNIIQNDTAHFNETEMKTLFDKVSVEGYEINTYLGSLIASTYKEIGTKIKSIKKRIEKCANPNKAYQLQQQLRDMRVEAVVKKGSQVRGSLRTLRCIGIIKFDESKNVENNDFTITIPPYILYPFIAEKVAKIEPNEANLALLPPPSPTLFFGQEVQVLHPFTLLNSKLKEEKKEDEKSGVLCTVDSVTPIVVTRFLKREGQTLQVFESERHVSGEVLRRAENRSDDPKPSESARIDENLTVLVNGFTEMFLKTLRNEFLPKKQIRLTPSVLPSNLTLSADELADLRTNVANFMRFDRRDDENSFAPAIERMTEGLQSAIGFLAENKSNFILDFNQFLSVQKDKKTGDFLYKKYVLRTFIDRNRRNHSLVRYADDAANRLNETGQTDFETKTLAKLLLNFADQVGKQKVEKWFVDNKIREWTTLSTKSEGLAYGTKKLCRIIEEYLDARSVGKTNWTQFHNHISSERKKENQRWSVLRNAAPSVLAEKKQEIVAQRQAEQVAPVPQPQPVQPKAAPIDKNTVIHNELDACLDHLTNDDDLRRRVIEAIGNRMWWDTSQSFDENCKFMSRKMALLNAYKKTVG